MPVRAQGGKMKPVIPATDRKSVNYDNGWMCVDVGFGPNYFGVSMARVYAKKFGDVVHEWSADNVREYGTEEVELSCSVSEYERRKGELP
jgi:hypothetical protein